MCIDATGFWLPRRIRHHTRRWVQCHWLPIGWGTIHADWSWSWHPDESITLH